MKVLDCSPADAADDAPRQAANTAIKHWFIKRGFIERLPPGATNLQPRKMFHAFPTRVRVELAQCPRVAVAVDLLGGIHPRRLIHVPGDDKGAVHVPFDPSVAFTTLELATITGTTLPEPL